MEVKPTNFPTVVILFGITGDLAHKKIIPALYHLFIKNKLPKLMSITGFSRRNLDETALHNLVIKSIEEHKDITIDKKILTEFLELFSYQQGDFTKQESYKKLGRVLGRNDGIWNTCANKLFYLSVPPKYYNSILDNLTKSALTEPCSSKQGWTRVIVEKPFGKDYISARALDEKMGKLFKEEQIYRIDHYLGKEMMQNVLLFRFSNNLLENSWNNKFIEKIEVKFLENYGVENRVGFYEGVGALRDVGQNHLLQMLALVTMENPGNLQDNSIRGKRTEILSNLKTLTEEKIKKQTERGQYEKYLTHKGVQKDSQTETYFKIQTEIDSPRWKGVPIIIEGGKNLSRTDKEIIIHFKPPNSCVCFGVENAKNVIKFDLDGKNKGISIDFWAKKPGLELEIEKKSLDFSFSKEDEHAQAEEYEKLLLDCIKGNQMLFVSTKEILAMWRFVDPIICTWDANKVPLEIYEKGERPKEQII